MGRLSSEEILSDNQTRDPESILSLSLTHKALSDVSCLRDFKNLERLDLSFNNLTSLEGLRECVNLKWLSVCQNKFQSLKGIEGLTRLTVLNAGKNKIRSLDEVQKLINLRALIMNDNEIVSICRLDELKYLNTLVLSRNPLRKMPLDKLKLISKLSLSNCQLEAIDTSIKGCTELKELRLAHNDIKTLPAELAHNIKLQNLDLGNNLVSRWSELKVLSSLKNLKNLNLHGNPIAEKDKLVKKIKKLVPNVRIFNSKPIEKYTKNEPADTVVNSSISNSLDLEASKKKNEERDHGDGKKHSTSGKEEKEVGDEDNHCASKNKKPKKKANDSGSDMLENKKPKKKVDNHVAEMAGKEEPPVISKDSKELASDQNAMYDDGDANNNDRKRKKEKKKTKEHSEKETSTQDSDTAVNEKKRKRKAGQALLEVIDNRDTPFAELLTADTHGSEEQSYRKPVHELDSLSSLVIEQPAKKKKMRSKGIGSSGLQSLSIATEVGLGGPSAWDDE